MAVRKTLPDSATADPTSQLVARSPFRSSSAGIAADVVGVWHGQQNA